MKGKVKGGRNVNGRNRSTSNKNSFEQLGVEKANVSKESRFIDDLGADSLDTVELVMALEDEFDCEIPDEEAEKL